MSSAEDHRAWVAAMVNRSIIIVFSQWLDLPEWSTERARAEVRVRRARHELDAYNEWVRRRYAPTRPDGAK